MQGESQRNITLRTLSNNNITSFNYKLIDNATEANEILTIILKDKGCILGIDIEAAVEMSRFGILCLLQVIN
jgi:hypothetical protein